MCLAVMVVVVVKKVGCVLLNRYSWVTSRVLIPQQVLLVTTWPTAAVS